MYGRLVLPWLITWGLTYNLSDKYATFTISLKQVQQCLTILLLVRNRVVSGPSEDELQRVRHTPSPSPNSANTSDILISLHQTSINLYHFYLLTYVYRQDIIVNVLFHWVNDICESGSGRLPYNKRLFRSVYEDMPI